MSGGVGTVEAPQQDLGNLNLEEAHIQTIDVERFEAVPEHDGNLQKLIDRYGDNPGSCPYIKSMGEAGVQLVQKLAEAEKNPDRGPTIRELMEAKKKEVHSQATAPEKSKPSKDTEAMPASKTERGVDKKSNERIVPDNNIEHVLAKDHVARIVSEAMEISTRQSVKLDVVSEESEIKITEKSPALVLEADNVLRQQALGIEARRISEIVQTQDQTLPIAEATIDPVIPRTPAVEKPSKIIDVTRPEKRVDPVVEFMAEELEAEIADDTTNHADTDKVRISPSVDLEATIVEDPTFDLDEIMTELGIEYPMTVESDGLETTVLMSELDTDINVEELEFDAMTTSNEISLDLTADETLDLRKQVAELDKATAAEAEEPHDLQVELRAYIETLEPSKAEAADTALKSLVEALEERHERTDIDAESPVIAVQEIEHLFVELLEALNLDYEDETMKKLIQDLITPELLAEITEDYELSIDQLNYMGTREYNPTSVTSLFSSLMQMIKQKIEPLLRLGKYALSTSFA